MRHTNQTDRFARFAPVTHGTIQYWTYNDQPLTLQLRILLSAALRAHFDGSDKDEKLPPENRGVCYKSRAFSVELN